MVTELFALTSVIGGGAVAGLVMSRFLLPRQPKAPAPPRIVEDPVGISRRLDAMLAPYAAHAA